MNEPRQPKAAAMPTAISGVRKKLADYWRGGLVGELDNASDELRAKFAEFFDLYITVHPKESSKGYSFDITANIPLEMEDNTVNAYDMVFTPSERGTKGVRLVALMA